MMKSEEKKEMVKDVKDKKEMVHIVTEEEKECRKKAAEKKEMVRIVTEEEKERRKNVAEKKVRYRFAYPNKVHAQDDGDVAGRTQVINTALPAVVSKTPVQPQVPQTQTELGVHACNGLGVGSSFWFDSEKKVLCSGDKPIANFYINIKQISSICDDKTGQCVGTLIDCKCYVWHGGLCTEYSFDKVRMDEVASYEFLNRMPYAASLCRNKGELTNYLYAYINSLIFAYCGEIVQLFGTSGWKRINSTQSVYVTAEGAIGYPDLKILSGDGFRIRNTYRDYLYPEFQKMRRTLGRPEQMDVILTYTFGQMIHTLFDEVNVGLKHILFVVGPRGSGKTAVSLCFTQLDNKNSPKYNFQATESGLQANLANHRDRVMLIDDLAPSSDIGEKRQKEHKLESIIRLFGDGTERVINTHFMKCNADKIDYSVHGGAVITGEYFYSTGSESSIARAVVIELGKESVNWEWLTYFQKNPQILESLVYCFLSFVGRNYRRTLDIIRETVEYYRKEMSKSQFSNKRYYDYWGQYMAVGKILMAFFQGKSGISVQEQQQYLDTLKKGVFYLLKENDQAMKQKAPVNEVIMSLIYLIESGNYGNWGEPFTEDRPLILSSEMLYFRQKDLPGIKQKYANKVNIQQVSMSSTEIGNLLEMHGYCESYMEGNKKRLGKKYNAYGNERLMCIPLHKIHEFQETMQIDY